MKQRAQDLQREVTYFTRTVNINEEEENIHMTFDLVAFLWSFRDDCHTVLRIQEDQTHRFHS